MVSIDRDATVACASRVMREADVEKLLVTRRIAGCVVPAGVIPARDIVVRVLGVALDPSVLTVGDVLECPAR